MAAVLRIQRLRRVKRNLYHHSRQSFTLYSRADTVVETPDGRGHLNRHQGQ
jgi:hypothetical protein